MITKWFSVSLLIHGKRILLDFFDGLQNKDALASIKVFQVFFCFGKVFQFIRYLPRQNP